MDTEHIAKHPTFRRLAFERRCLGLGLAVTMATAYFAYILTVAFDPAALGTPVQAGSILTWGVVAGVALLCFGFLLTATYVLVANTRLDALSQRLQEDVG